MLMKRHAGFTLVELLIGVAIAFLLLVASAPALTTWIKNAQNRTAAESILDGLQLARLEAVKRNAVVRFKLTDGAGQVIWSVGCANVTSDCPATIQSRAVEGGAANARVGVSTTAIPNPIPPGHFNAAIAAGAGLAAGVSFNGIGRVPTNNVGDDITRIDVTNPAFASARRYVVIIDAGGLIRMCDPSLDFSSNPQGCS